MKSPFPGMDPYLERHWGDVHTRFMVYASNLLNRQLPFNLQARVEEGLAFESEDANTRYIFPDVQIVEGGGPADFETTAAAAATGVAEMTKVRIPSEQPVQRYVEIIDTTDGNRVVTAIELLSPANNTGNAGREQYRRKQLEYIAAGVNLVEIDLIRAGKFNLAIPEDQWPKRQQAPYKICIRRVSEQIYASCVGVSLREKLPVIPIPLRPRDTDATLDLQAILDDCYQDGRYAKTNYNEPPTPPFDDEDVTWARERIKERMADFE